MAHSFREERVGLFFAIGDLGDVGLFALGTYFRLFNPSCHCEGQRDDKKGEKLKTRG